MLDGAELSSNRSSLSEIANSESKQTLTKLPRYYTAAEDISQNWEGLCRYVQIQAGEVAKQLRPETTPLGPQNHGESCKVSRRLGETGRRPFK